MNIHKNMQRFSLERYDKNSWSGMLISHIQLDEDRQI